MKTISTGLAFATGLCLSTFASAETVLTMGSVAPSSSPWGQWAAGVAAAVEEQTGGELRIELILDAQAGDEQTILRQTMRGRLDIALVSNTPLTLIAPEISLAAAPYLFDSVEQGSCVVHEHMTDAFGGMMEGAGVVPLTWMEVGQYIVFSTQPLATPEDLDGLSLRVAATVTDEAFARSLGASGVPMGTSDTIPRLADGQCGRRFLPNGFWHRHRNPSRRAACRIDQPFASDRNRVGFRAGPGAPCPKSIRPFCAPRLKPRARN